MNDLYNHLDLENESNRIVYEINKRNEGLYGPYIKEMSMFQKFVRRSPWHDGKQEERVPENDLNIIDIYTMPDGKTKAIKFRQENPIKFFVDSLGDGGKKVIECGYQKIIYVHPDGKSLHTGHPTVPENAITDEAIKRDVVFSVGKYTNRAVSEAFEKQSWVRGIE